MKKSLVLAGLVALAVLFLSVSAQAVGQHEVLAKGTFITALDMNSYSLEKAVAKADLVGPSEEKRRRHRDPKPEPEPEPEPLDQ